MFDPTVLCGISKCRSDLADELTSRAMSITSDLVHVLEHLPLPQILSHFFPDENLEILPYL